MHAFKNGRRGQEGSVIIIVMIVLALLTIIGISATNMSTTEQKIAGNDKNYKIAFYHAESGNYGMAKWVAQVLDDNELPKEVKDLGEGEEGKHRFEYLDEDTSELMDEVLGYDDTYDEAKDVEFAMTSGVTGGEDDSRMVPSNVTVDLNRLKARQAVGGGAEFGTGASGIGERPAIEIPYWFASDAESASGAHATISSQYIKLLGVPGGL
jgi:hypothetical protein